MLVRFRIKDPGIGKVRIADKLVGVHQLTDEAVERNWDRLKGYFEPVAEAQPAQKPAAKAPRPEPGPPTNGKD